MLFYGKGIEAVVDLNIDEKNKESKSFLGRFIPMLKKLGVADLKVDEKGPYFERKEIITFGDTNAEGNVGHDVYARIFGKVRELFGLTCIPKFKERAGKEYLLKTKKAIYEFYRDFCFGDEMIVKMRVSEVGGASFVLKAEFVGSDSVHAVGEHLIAYADMTGKPQRMPYGLKTLLKSVRSKA